MGQRVTLPSVLLVSLSLTQPLAGQQWQRIPSTAHPPKEAFVAMAYDEVRNRVVCVADEDIGSFGNMVGRLTTWEWDGARWLQRVTATAPPGVPDRHALAYDPTRGRVVLVNRRGETWSFDGVDWQLEPISSYGGNYPSLAFDPVRGVLVLATGSGAYHGIYEVVNGAWTQRATFTPSGEGTLIGFDPVSGRILAFGGLDMLTFGSPNLNTTRSWDGTSLTTLAPATVPNGRAEHTLVNDPLTGQLLLIGGHAYQSPVGTLAEVHAWNGSDWVVQPSLPSPRMQAAIAPLGGFLWLLGDRQGPGLWPTSHELLRRDAAGAWTTVPLPISGPYSAHDPVRARTVSADGGRTLEFDGYRWIDVGIPAPAVTALAFHAPAARIVALDGAGATWLYDGLAWTQVAVPLGPPPRVGAGMGHDPVRGVLVLFGGMTGANTWVNDVWEWNGVAWSNPQPATAPPAGFAAIAWDGQSLVAIAANPTISGWTTWTWSGTAWSQIATAPGLVMRLRLAHDPALGLVAVVTPALPFVDFDYGYQLVGTTWQPVGSATGAVLDRRGIGSLVFDTNRGQVVLHDWQNERDFILSAQHATRQPYGAACSTTALMPRLSSPVPPHLGTASISDLDRATPSSFAFLLADLAQANVPLPGGCTVLVSNPIVLAAAPTNGAGFASATFAIPRAPALRGIDLFEQALVLDPAGALFGFANLTNGLQLRIGD